MDWNERHDAGEQPSLADIESFIKAPFWGDLNAFLQGGYGVAPGVIPGCSPYTRELFQNTAVSMGQRWLMIRVTDHAILDDVKALIQVRRKIKA